ncbi:WXG100 family type VII secretion target [Micromonospora sp. NPDC003197]
MANYAVHTGAIDDGQSSLRAITAKLEESLAALTAKASAFKAANEGLAIEGYAEAQHLWEAGLREMNGALSSHTARLGQIGANYVDADLMGSSLFRR